MNLRLHTPDLIFLPFYYSKKKKRMRGIRRLQRAKSERKKSQSLSNQEGPRGEREHMYAYG